VAVRERIERQVKRLEQETICYPVMVPPGLGERLNDPHALGSSSISWISGHIGIARRFRRADFPAAPAAGGGQTS
jgi:hypothetical protein